MLISLPTRFKVDYPIINHPYYSDSEYYKSLFRNLLLSASSAYCMYCGKDLNSDGNIHCNIDHVVDKGGKNAKNILMDCKFNLAVACEKCNQILKSRVDRIDFTRYENIVQCTRKTCSVPCKRYEKLRRDYYSKNAIILPPLGVKGKNEEELKISFNVFSGFFEPAFNISCEENLLFVQKHIYRFHLNGSMLTESVTELCAEIYDLCSRGLSKTDVFEHMKQRRMPNIVATFFLSELEKLFASETSDMLKEYCMLIVVESAFI